MFYKLILKTRKDIELKSPIIRNYSNDNNNKIIKIIHMIGNKYC